MAKVLVWLTPVAEAWDVRCSSPGYVVRDAASASDRGTHRCSRLNFAATARRVFSRMIVYVRKMMASRDVTEWMALSEGMIRSIDMSWLTKRFGRPRQRGVEARRHSVRRRGKGPGRVKTLLVAAAGIRSEKQVIGMLKAGRGLKPSYEAQSSKADTVRRSSLFRCSTVTFS